MTGRPDYTGVAVDHTRRLMAFTHGLRDGAIDATTRELVNVRVSQINGCAFCIDTHGKQARMAGETVARLMHLSAWHDSPLFTGRERAALAWAELLTHLPPGGIPDDAYGAAQEVFGDVGLVDLTYVVMAINAWNRASIAFRLVPGSKDEAYGLAPLGPAMPPSP